VNRIPVLVPGIFGSTLRYGERVIWGCALLQSFRDLSSDSGLLTWSGRPAEAEFIETFCLLPGIGRFDIWSRCIKLLRGENDTIPSEDWVRFGYDWRQSIEASATDLCHVLRDRLNTDVASEPPTHIKERLLVITHSMGALVVRAAIGSGELNTGWLDRIIHVGAPLQGAPAAMRAAFDETEWPFLGRLFGVVWNPSAFRRSKLICAMEQAGRTFDSVYQMIPPATIDYVYQVTGSPLFNPLSPATSKFTQKQLALADSFDRVLRSAERIIKNRHVPLYCLYSKGCDTCIYLHITYDDSTYRVLRAISVPDGDGTVPSYSAKGDGAAVSLQVDDVTHDWLCNDKKVVDRMRGAL
jgi:hypothetical protein